VLVDHHQRRLMATAYHLLNDRDDAADAVQEAFLRAYRALDQYDETQRVGAWLGRIGVNVCLSMLRTRRRRPVAASGEWEARAPEYGYLRVEQAMVLRAALAALDERDRAMVLLRHIHGLTSAEIGATIGLPAATVRTRLARGLQAIRVVLPEVADLRDLEESLSVGIVAHEREDGFGK